MNRAEKFGRVSFAITSASLAPYLWGVWSGRYHPSVTSWILWTLIGFSMLVSYKRAGAKESRWVALVAFTNPLAVLIVTIWKGGSWDRLGPLDLVAGTIGIGALALSAKRESARWGVFSSILADVCAGAPTVFLAWSLPMEEQPIPWLIYFVGECVGLFSVTKKTPEEYSLPIYGIVLGLAVVIPTFAHRIIHHLPFL